MAIDKTQPLAKITAEGIRLLNNKLEELTIAIIRIEEKSNANFVVLAEISKQVKGNGSSSIDTKIKLIEKDTEQTKKDINCLGEKIEKQIDELRQYNIKQDDKAKEREKEQRALNIKLWFQVGGFIIAIILIILKFWIDHK